MAWPPEPLAQYVAFTATVAVVFALLAFAFVRRLTRARHKRARPACPRCGLSLNPAQWPRKNYRKHYHGRYTVTPYPTCPRCGYVLEQAEAPDSGG